MRATQKTRARAVKQIANYILQYIEKNGTFYFTFVQNFALQSEMLNAARIKKLQKLA